MSIQEALPYLPTFVAAAEAGTFSEAAKRLALTQSAVSKQIQALERSVGSVLFDRLPRRLVLTEAGEVLAHVAKQIMGQLSDVDATLADRSARRPQGPVTIGTTPSVGTYLLPGWLHALVQQLPEVQPVVRFAAEEELIAAVQAGDLDMAIVAGAVYPDVLDVRPVLEDPYRLVASPQVAGTIREEVDLAGLALPLALPEPGDPWWQKLEDLVFRPLAWYPHPAWRMTHFEAMKRFVREGFGATILPMHVVADDLASGRLVAIATSVTLAVQTIDLVRHKERKATRTLSAVWGELQRLSGG